MRKMIVVYGLLLIISIFMLIKWLQVPEYREYTWPNLPVPIGKEPVLITSAGQATDGYVIDMLAKELHIDADYRPRALSTDIYDYKTVVMVMGFSAHGLDKNGETLSEEKLRIKELIEETKRHQMPLILIHLSGSGRMDAHTLEFIEMATPYASYFIGLRSANDRKLGEFVQTGNIPITLVSNVSDLKTPMNSVFR